MMQTTYKQALAADYPLMKRVTKDNRCPICGKRDWCLLAEDGTAAICARISDGSIKTCGAAGYLHILEERPLAQRPRRRRTVQLKTPEPKLDLGRMAAEFGAAIDYSRLDSFARALGLGTDSLARLRIGWAAEHQAWSFPMHDADGDVRGIRLRTWSARKFGVRGGREGLFWPSGLTFELPLLIAEGPTDVAALLDLDFQVVGRPSCTGGLKLLAELVSKKQPPQVVILADGDGPGIRGAETLASVLVLECLDVRVIRPPDGIKDMREWKLAGGTAEDVLETIDSVLARRLGMVRSRR